MAACQVQEVDSFTIIVSNLLHLYYMLCIYNHWRLTIECIKQADLAHSVKYENLSVVIFHSNS